MKKLMPVLALVLSGCAGIASYTIEPFTDTATGKLICCKAVVLDGQDKAAVNVAVQNNADGTFNLSFSETSVSASLPMTANAQTASAVAGAVTSAANAAVQFSLKP
jgi:hypothetical protein